MTRWSKSAVITTGQPRRAAIPSVDLYTTGAPGAITTARCGAAFQPRCSHGRGGWTHGAADMHRGYPWKACRKPSENQTQLDPRGARHRPPPSPRAPPPSARRGGRAVPPRVRPADSHARSYARGVLAWRQQVGLSGMGRGVAWMGTPGAYTCICAVEQGWLPRSGGRRRWPRWC